MCLRCIRINCVSKFVVRPRKNTLFVFFYFVLKKRNNAQIVSNAVYDYECNAIATHLVASTNIECLLSFGFVYV